MVIKTLLCIHLKGYITHPHGIGHFECPGCSAQALAKRKSVIVFKHKKDCVYNSNLIIFVCDGNPDEEF